MKDINAVMPKIPGMKWGALFNWKLSNAEVNSIIKNPPFPKDGKWHSVVNHDKNITVDGKTTRRRSAESLT